MNWQWSISFCNCKVNIYIYIYIYIYILARNQTKAWARDPSTRSEVDKGTPISRVEEGTQRRELAKGDAEGQSTTDCRRDQAAWDRVQEHWGKTSQDESAFLAALWKFREGSTSALVYGYTGNAVSRNHPSCTWVDLSLYCSFVLCSFSPTPSVEFLVA